MWVNSGCDGTSRENASSRAVAWGASTLNLSFGHDSNREADGSANWYDEIVMMNSRTVVVAAGNTGSSGSSCQLPDNGNVWSPGTAYNVITVGASDDKDTTQWSDDIMWNCSSWKDPVSTYDDREKPELAASGFDIQGTQEFSPWIGDIGDGTSLSAPIVAGAASLLMQRESALKQWPEIIKSILMATAVNNIEGGGRLSEFDGAGGIRVDRGDDIVQLLNRGGMSYDCNTTTPLDVVAPMLLDEVRTRVVIAWDNHPDYFYYQVHPSANLILQIVDSVGNVVAASGSKDNTYEIVDFTPPSAGEYKLRVRRARCDMDPMWLGWAWWQQ